MRIDTYARRLSAALLLVGVLTSAADASTIVMGGTGGATESLRLITARFAADTGLPTQILAGLGSGGAIKAARDGTLQVAVSGRPLTADEEKQGLITAVIACTPYVMATSNRAPGSLNRAMVTTFYSQPSSRWPDGQPVRVVLRPRNESDNLVLFKVFPGTEEAVREIRKHDSVPIASTDQDNADLAQSIEGSLIGTTYMQMTTEKRLLTMIPIDGVTPDLTTYESGRYPFAKRIHVIVKRDAAAGVTRFMDFLNSPAGMSAMRETGLVSCRQPG